MVEEAGEVFRALLQLESRMSTSSGLNRSDKEREAHSLQLPSQSPCGRDTF